MGRPIQLTQKIFVRLWLTWKVKQSFLTGYVRTINQSNSSRNKMSTNWITEISSEKAQKIWSSDAKCQTTTLVHMCQTSRHFYNRSGRFIVLIVVTEKKYILILRMPTSPVRDWGYMLRQRILQGYCFFKTYEIYMFDTLVLGQFLSDFVQLKSNVSPRLSTLTYPREMFDQTTHFFIGSSVA